MRSILLLLSVFIPVVASSLGCMEERLSGLVSVEGTVMYENKPVANALVSFSPVGTVSGLRSAFAMTDADGRFTMTTLYPNDGVIPGEYKVAIKKMEETTAKEVKSLLPQKYADVETSGLPITVTSRGNPAVEFVLSD